MKKYIIQTKEIENNGKLDRKIEKAWQPYLFCLDDGSETDIEAYSHKSSGATLTGVCYCEKNKIAAVTQNQYLNAVMVKSKIGII